MKSIANLLNQQTKIDTDIWKVDENEYYDEINNTIRCKKCNDKLLTDFEVFGRRQRCICQCKVKELEEEKEREKQQRKLIALEKLKNASLIGEKYKNVEFDTTLKTHETFNKALLRCKKYCDISGQALEKGYGMYIYGNSGTGKTHLTACMCNELLKQGQQCLFTNFFEISKSIRATFNKNSEDEATMINRITKIDFLFIDDLGTEIVRKNGEDTWLQEKIFEIINKRYNDNKPTIFSSNYSLDELIDDRGIMNKTVDRIAEMSTAILKIEGDSYRLTNRKKEIPF